MIEVSQLSKVYQTDKHPYQALDDINLNIHEGEFFGVIGRSGAGKSTLIRCINLLERPTHGKVTLNNYNLVDLTAKQLVHARRKIGKIFQHFNLLNSRNVFGNVALPLELAKIGKQDIKNRVTEILALVGLEGHHTHYPDQLSGGQKQRVAIARALATEPDILLCDEPTSALDPETTQRILQLLTSIQNKLKVTVIFVTHQVNIVKQYCNRVAVLDQGRCVEQGNVADVFNNPQHPATSSLLNLQEVNHHG